MHTDDVHTDDAERASGDPDPLSGPGSGPATRPDTDLVDEALDAMTRAVASLRDQAARMINAAPPLVAPPAEPPREP